MDITAQPIGMQQKSGFRNGSGGRVPAGREFSGGA
jgi:hypothetical protein